MTTAFQINSDDVVTVLRRRSLHVANSGGRRFEDMAAEIIDDLDADRIEFVALRASTDLDEQTDAALEEIERQLVDIGVIKG